MHGVLINTYMTFKKIQIMSGGQWRSEGVGVGGGGGGGQLPPGADLRGAPKCLGVYYK